MKHVYTVEIKGDYVRKLLSGHTDTRRTVCFTWTTKVLGKNSGQAPDLLPNVI